MFNFPIHTPGMTWGLGDRSAYTPGPGGPLVDPRRTTLTPAPIYGRVGKSANFMSFVTPQVPGIGWAPWSQMVNNNAFATALMPLWWAGWLKQAPTANSGF